MHNAARSAGGQYSDFATTRGLEGELTKDAAVAFGEAAQVAEPVTQRRVRDDPRKAGGLQLGPGAGKPSKRQDALRAGTQDARKRQLQHSGADDHVGTQRADMQRSICPLRLVQSARRRGVPRRRDRCYWVCTALIDLKASPIVKEPGF